MKLCALVAIIFLSGCSSPEPYRIPAPDSGSAYKADERAIKSLKAGESIHRSAQSGILRTFRCGKREIWVDGAFRGTSEWRQGKPVAKYTRLNNGGLRAEFWGIGPFERAGTNECFGLTTRILSDWEPITEATFHDAKKRTEEQKP